MSTKKPFDTNRSVSGSSQSDQGKKIRGLPQPEDLKALAITYLTEQGKYWPTLVGSALLPAANDDSAVELAADFELRLTAHDYTPSPVRVPASNCKDVGAAYVRYSDSNSNTRSLDQQLVNILATASRDRIFVPWCFVFADAAISGTVASRPGYQLLVKAMETTGCVTVAVIDELDRLSRDQEISVKFGKMLARLGKRLIASQGYDSKSSSAKITFAISSLTSDLYIDQLKLKVDRGMTDCVNRGHHVAAPPLGYRLVHCLDADGRPILGPNRKLISEVVIDQAAADVVNRIFELYSKSKMSPQAIALVFNKELVLGRSGWNTSGIATLLTHELYIGIRKWKRTRNDVDSQTGKRTTTRRPADEQIANKVPELRIITDELWEAVGRRKNEVVRKPRLAGQASKSRQSQYPTRLFDLHCQDCEKPLHLFRSNGENSRVRCPSQLERKNRCSLTVSKSTRQIKECILAELSQRLLNKESLGVMVTTANDFLAKVAEEPPVDMAAIEKQIRAATEKIKRYAERFSELDKGSAADVVFEKIKKEQAWLEDLQRQKAVGAQQNFRPEPLTPETLRNLVADLRLLLQEDVVAAHAVLAKAIGRVHVKMGPKCGKRYS